MRVFFAFLALAIVGIVATQAFQAGLADAGDTVEIEGETWTPDAGKVTTLDQSNLENAYYDRTVNVTDENGTQSFEGEDYEWNEHNGTVKALQGGNLDGDSSATIDYGYEQTTAEQRGFTAMLSQIPSVLGLALPLGLVLLLLAIIGGG